MPAGTDAIEPWPLPVTIAVNAWVGLSNLAVAVVSLEIVTSQVGDVPLHAPLQPANAAPADGTATSFTVEPTAKPELQVAPQLMPAGVESTSPVALPVAVTVSVFFAISASTLMAASGVAGEGPQAATAPTKSPNFKNFIFPPRKDF
jgi:hypothetical protein